jgi:diaminopimelate epimerase
MEIIFYKYQGTGNDFVMVDDRQQLIDETNLIMIASLCDRRFGIGADGLILIRNHKDYDFEMIYFNADGSQSMCGNGARCTVAFSFFLGIISEKTHFLAIDGQHEALIDGELVHLKMGETTKVQKCGMDYFVDTGSPHHIRFVDNVASYPVLEEGMLIRHNEIYSPAGTNVNFVEKLTEDQIFVRTFERGVEDETLSCGTGVTAAALVFARDQSSAHVKINTIGGQLSVKFDSNPDGTFKEVWLIGPAEQVYQGKINF